jgi:hypothetical protein
MKVFIHGNLTTIFAHENVNIVVEKGDEPKRIGKAIDVDFPVHLRNEEMMVTVRLQFDDINSLNDFISKAREIRAKCFGVEE